MNSSFSFCWITWIFQEHMWPFESASDCWTLRWKWAKDNWICAYWRVFVQSTCISETLLTFLQSGLAFSWLASKFIFVIDNRLSKVLSIFESERIDVHIGIWAPWTNAGLALSHNKWINFINEISKSNLFQMKCLNIQSRISTLLKIKFYK